jgi:hypothetical protein
MGLPVVCYFLHSNGCLVRTAVAGAALKRRCDFWISCQPRSVSVFAAAFKHSNVLLLGGCKLASVLGIYGCSVTLLSSVGLVACLQHAHTKVACALSLMKHVRPVRSRHTFLQSDVRDLIEFCTGRLSCTRNICELCWSNDVHGALMSQLHEFLRFAAVGKVTTRTFRDRNCNWVACCGFAPLACRSSAYTHCVLC